MSVDGAEAISSALEAASFVQSALARAQSLGAEQALLGAILANNRVFDRVRTFLRPDHFADPFHARVFGAMAEHIEAGKVADGVTLHRLFARDEVSVRDEDGLIEKISGADYIGRLLAALVGIQTAYDYARVIHDLYLRRQAISRLYSTMMSIAVEDQSTPAMQTFQSLAMELDELILDGSGGGTTVSFGSAAVSAVQRAERIYRTGGVPGVSTGIRSIDKAIMGLEGDRLYILGGRPGMAKTSLGLQIARHVARQQGGAAFFSLEMSKEQLAYRAMIGDTGLRTSDFMNARASDAAVWMAADQWARDQADLALAIEDKPGLPIAELMSRARAIKRRQKVALIVIDHLQLIRPPKQAAGQPTYGVELITNALKGLAKELDTPIIALSQLSRAVENREDKRPRMDDLRQSGSIEQDADVVMLLYREAYYLKKTRPQKGAFEKQEDFDKRWSEWDQRQIAMAGKAELIIGKNRDGIERTVHLKYDEERFRFAEADASTQDQLGFGGDDA
jgi:replicative DNA helicase